MSELTVECPFCRSTRTRMISLFGSQLLLSQYRCAACGSYFEGLRPDAAEADSLLCHPAAERGTSGA
jgi:transposase-like protein